MVTVFCIRRAGEPPPEGLTLPDGELVRLVEEGPLGVWVCDKAFPATLEAVRIHDAVVRRALRSATPVPTRFATGYSTEEELRFALRKRQEQLLGKLLRVAGKVEMGMRVEWKEAAEAPEAMKVRSGREYLEARRRELVEREALRQQADALLDRVEERLGVESVSAVRNLLPERGVAGVMAHLVHRRLVRAYRSRVEEARLAFPHVHLDLTGPWAPYSFV